MPGIPLIVSGVSLIQFLRVISNPAEHSCEIFINFHSSIHQWSEILMYEVQYMNVPEVYGGNYNKH